MGSTELRATECATYKKTLEKATKLKFLTVEKSRKLEKKSVKRIQKISACLGFPLLNRNTLIIDEIKKRFKKII